MKKLDLFSIRGMSRTVIDNLMIENSLEKVGQNFIQRVGGVFLPSIHQPNFLFFLLIQANNLYQFRLDRPAYDVPDTSI